MEISGQPTVLDQVKERREIVVFKRFAIEQDRRAMAVGSMLAQGGGERAIV
jgi:hypothetical protein